MCDRDPYTYISFASCLLYTQQHSETQVVMISSPATTVSNLNTAIFRNAAAESFGTKAISLFPGVGYGAAYKILQRVYKFGGQPVVLDYMTKKYGADFDERFGHKTGRTLLSAASGSLIGIGEGKYLNVCKMKNGGLQLQCTSNMILHNDDSCSPST